MQYPTEVPGVSLVGALSEALQHRGRDSAGLSDLMKAEADQLGSSIVFSTARLMSTFQEARRSEMRHCSSQFYNQGCDSRRTRFGARYRTLEDCSRRVEELSNDAANPLGVLAITHYSRLLNELRPDHIHILVKGQIVTSGGAELADILERDGYAAFTGDDDEAAEESAPSSLDDLFKM